MESYKIINGYAHLGTIRVLVKPDWTPRQITEALLWQAHKAEVPIYDISQIAENGELINPYYKGN